MTLLKLYYYYVHHKYAFGTYVHIASYNSVRQLDIATLAVRCIQCGFEYSLVVIILVKRERIRSDVPSKQNLTVIEFLLIQKELFVFINFTDSLKYLHLPLLAFSKHFRKWTGLLWLFFCNKIRHLEYEKNEGERNLVLVLSNIHQHNHL